MCYVFGDLSCMPETQENVDAGVCWRQLMRCVFRTLSFWLHYIMPRMTFIKIKIKVLKDTFLNVWVWSWTHDPHHKASRPSPKMTNLVAKTFKTQPKRQCPLFFSLLLSPTYLYWFFNFCKFSPSYFIMQQHWMNVGKHSTMSNCHT